MRRRGPKVDNSEDRQQGAEGLSGRELLRLYRSLRGRFGFQDWWPADSDLEVVVGAILTQQSTWTNVEKAIRNLKRARALSLARISSMKRETLEALIRPSGYYRQKAERLQLLCREISRSGSLKGFLSRDAETLRTDLLSQKGVGKETCDSIMLYAGGIPTFVIDAYTMRIMGRAFNVYGDYDRMQGLFHNALKGDVELYKDMHAQFVELAKRHCRKSPSCDGCPLLGTCAYGKLPTSTDARQRAPHGNS